MKRIDEIFDNLKLNERKILSVASAADEEVLEAVRGGYDAGISDAILIGDADDIRRIAESAEIDVSPFEIVSASSDAEAADTAMGLVSAGNADMVMKGLLSTSVFLKALFDPKHGLRREDGIVSALPFFELPFLDRLLFITDPGFIPAPDLDAKAKMIDNAVPILRALGVEKPNVAVLCAAETVNSKIPATVDAQELMRMNEDGILEGCTVVGPISLDLAISEASAAHKGFRHPAAGRADLLLAPSIEAANIFYKALTCFCDFKLAGLIAGARKPVVMTSRADSPETKLNTIAVAAYLAGGAAGGR